MLHQFLQTAHALRWCPAVLQSAAKCCRPNQTVRRQASTQTTHMSANQAAHLAVRHVSATRELSWVSPHPTIRQHMRNTRQYADIACAGSSLYMLLVTAACKKNFKVNGADSSRIAAAALSSCSAITSTTHANPPIKALQGHAVMLGRRSCCL